MIREQNDFDLSFLAGKFVECDDYTKEIILAELLWYQKNEPDFLVLIYGKINGALDGFLIAHRNRNSLWIAQVWHRNDIDLLIGKKAIIMAGKWAKKRGMTSMTYETNRNEFKAMEKYGFNEYSVIMRVAL